MFVFTTLKDVGHISKDESEALGSVLGAFPASAASKACHIVQNIVSFLTEDSLALISRRCGERKKQLSKEFGSDIKFESTLLRKSYSIDDALASDSDEGDASMENGIYSYGDTCQIPVEDTPAQIQNGLDEFSNSWFRDQCQLHFANSPSGLSVLDLCSAVFDILSSARDDAAIQNDLFELLGFDHFEFIQKLLADRHQIVLATVGNASDSVNNESRYFGHLC